MPMQPSPSAETARPPSFTCLIVVAPFCEPAELPQACGTQISTITPALAGRQYRDLPRRTRDRLASAERSYCGDMSTSNALGEFLRARREQLRPEDVGLEDGGHRRTPGLRREGVAMLAGISTDYYLRLEQGRDRTPSVQVAEAVGRVLRLDADEAAYLHTLARPRPRRAPRRRPEKVPPGTLRLLESLPMPAFVQDRYLNVLAANPMAQALSPGMRPGV